MIEADDRFLEAGGTGISQESLSKTYYQLHKNNNTMVTSNRSVAYTAAAVAVASLSFISSSVYAQSAGNYCGSSWLDAVSKCQQPCPSGAPSECAAGETCFAGTPVSFLVKTRELFLSFFAFMH